MALQVKAPAIKSDDLSLNPLDPHGKGREPALMGHPLASMCVLGHGHSPHIYLLHKLW